MTSAYPGSLDDFNNPGPETQRNDPAYRHHLQHSNVNDAVEAVQQELGTTPSGAFSSVKERLNAVDQNLAITSSYWAFDVLVNDEDPGAGEFRLNNSTRANATFLFLSELNRAGINVSSFMPLLVSGDRVFIQATDDPTEIARYVVSGSAVDAIGYWKIPIEIELTSGGAFSAGQDCQIVWAIAAFGGVGGGAGVWIGDDPPPPVQDPGDFWYDTDEPTAATGFPIDDTPLHPVYGDDFGGPTLDPKWTRRNLSAGNEIFSNQTWMSTTLTGYLPMDKLYYQSAPSGDFTVVLSLKMYVPYDTMIGPMIIDNTGAGVAWVPTDGWELDTILLSAYTRSAWGGFLDQIVWESIATGQRLWLALKKTGTTYTGRWSSDGMFWSGWSTPYTWAGTPTRIGFGRVEATSYYTALLSQMHIDRFNVEQ